MWKGEFVVERKDLEVLKNLGLAIGDVLYDTKTGNYLAIADVNGNLVLKGVGTENRYSLSYFLTDRNRFRKA